MSGDINHPNFPFFEKEPSDSEKHKEHGIIPLLSNVPTDEHPFFSSNGIRNLINEARNMCNSIHEKELSGKINDAVIEDLCSIAQKTKIPYDVLLFVADWEKDMTSRSDAKDCEQIAKKIMNNIPKLRQSLQRDPFFSEIFASHILGSVEKVKEIIDKAKEKPDDPVQSLGVKKENIITKKNRNNKEQTRTNRELYDWFQRRIPNGKETFNDYVPEEAYKDIA